MLDDRKLAVLGTVVVDYVQSREPVGSRTLVERHHMDVSPATIRNDMAALEEEGYLTQPHTSAGRVPTDKGYRLFVDKLATVKPLTPAERRAIGSFMQGAVGVDDVVARTARLLAQLTHQVAIVQYPSPAPAGMRLVVGGVPNLTKFGAEYETMIEPLLEAIEEQVVLLRLLGEAAADREDVTVRIGTEHPYETLRDASIVASAYTPSQPADGTYAALGVVGPTRMDYPSTMSAVRAVARYVGRFLGGEDGC